MTTPTPITGSKSGYKHSNESCPWDRQFGGIVVVCSEKRSARAGPRAPVRLDLDRIRSAVSRIAPVFRNTPQYVCPPLGEALGCELILKLETANPIRCFKGRGTETVMARLADSGVRAAICASAGNLGQALAYIADEAEGSRQPSLPAAARIRTSW